MVHNIPIYGKKLPYRGKELKFQFSAADYLDTKKLFWIHVPNEGKRKNGFILKRAGMKAGASDVLIFEPRGKYNGLFIELKVEENTARDNQIEFLQSAAKRGYAVAIIYNLDELIRVVEYYLSLKPTPCEKN